MANISVTSIHPKFPLIILKLPAGQLDQATPTIMEEIVHISIFPLFFC